MQDVSDRDRQPVFEIVPGKSIGPLRLGMSRREITEICREAGLQVDLPIFKRGVNLEFDEADQIVSIEVPAGLNQVRLSIAGKELKSFYNDEVRTLLAEIIPLPGDWTEPEESGIAIFHWEFGDPDVFSFMVFLPGHRFRSTPKGRPKE
jgi:hypothetical protein